MAGISIWQLVIIAVIVVLLFGTKKLRHLGSDLGSSLKGFKKAISDIDNEQNQETAVPLADTSSNSTTTPMDLSKENKV